MTGAGAYFPAPREHVLNADELLDPAYRWFMDEPSSNWTLHTLADIRARVSASWATAAPKR
ncbi:hypothetical protein ALP86_04884, partial [Pseudomonas amygdali pv. mori]